MLPEYQDLVDLAEDSKGQTLEIWHASYPYTGATIQLHEDRTVTMTLRGKGDDQPSLVLGPLSHPKHADPEIEQYTAVIQQLAREKLKARTLREFLRTQGNEMLGFVGSRMHSNCLRVTLTDLKPATGGSYPYDAAKLSMSKGGEDLEVRLFVAAHPHQSNPALIISNGVRIRQHGELNHYIPEILARMGEKTDA